MSSNSDRTIFDNAVSPQDNSVLFSEKKWNYITDSSSNGGVFNGQLQFDLQTVNSMSAFVNMSEAYIQVPVKISCKNSGAGAQTLAISSLLAGFRNGTHNLVDSVQVVLDGKTLQASQIYQNISTSYKILSEWSQDELKKYGPTLNMSQLDEFVPYDNDETNIPLTELTTTVIANGNFGLDMTVGHNQGYMDRVFDRNTVNNTTSSILSKAIYGTSSKQLGNGQLALSVGSVAVGSDHYVEYILATIRLRDISPVFEAMPPVRNMRGFIYINYNASQTVITGDGTTATTVAGASNSALYGRCNPCMLTSARLLTGASAVSYSTTWTCEVSATSSPNLTTASPPQTYARLVCPSYSANPDIERALTMTKTIRYLERNVTTFDLSAGSSGTITLSPGIQNAKRVVLFPYWNGTQTESGLTNLRSDPLLSPFEATGGMATGIYAAMSNLQILVGNKPMWQNPVSYGYDMFLQEIAQQGVEGGQDNTIQSGLLNQRQWEKLYRYITCDVSRRLESDDGASKSVIVQATNPTTLNMRVIAFIYYEKQITIDTALCKITN